MIDLGHDTTLKSIVVPTRREVKYRVPTRLTVIDKVGGEIDTERRGGSEVF